MERDGGSCVCDSPRICASVESMSECEEKLCEWGVWPVGVWPFGGDVREGFGKADGAWYWDCGKLWGAWGGGGRSFDVAESGMRVWTFGGKMGSSGCRMVAMRRRLTTLAWGRVEKYARFCCMLVGTYEGDCARNEHTSSTDKPSAATRCSAPETTVCVVRWHGPHSHSFSRTVTTSLSMGGVWQYWWYAVLHASQNTMRLLEGSTSRWHVLHLAASSVLVDFLRLTPWAGSGMVGTNATGLFTLRPDFVRVGSGVYESEMSELSSSCTLSTSVAAAALSY
jgi:hypothetical protein